MNSKIKTILFTLLILMTSTKAYAQMTLQLRMPMV